MCVSQWPADRAPGLPSVKVVFLFIPKPQLWGLCGQSPGLGISQELTQTVPFWEKVLAKMVAKQLQGQASTVMISLSFFPPFEHFLGRFSVSPLDVGIVSNFTKDVLLLMMEWRLLSLPAS